MSAEANSVGGAQHEAEPGPEDPATQQQDEEDQLDARGPRAQRPHRGTHRGEEPSMATALASRPPSLSSASTTTSTSGSSSGEEQGGVPTVGEG
jgi:hypothetical protein